VICWNVGVNARRLLAALALTGSVLAVGTAPAVAGTASDAKHASAVFTGTVTRATTTPAKRHAPSATTADVEVKRVYKGAIATTTVRVGSTRTSRDCARVRLREHREYVFFVSGDGSDLTTDGCSGTRRADRPTLARVEGVLGDGRPPVPPRPEQAVFSRVVDAEPPTLTRMAAPGIALVIVGLLGLVVVRRLGARG
jgi:hypothetical protein